MTSKLGGRPPEYATAEELQKAIDEFIKDPPTRKGHRKDGSEFDIPSLTITGLCYALGFASRQSFYDYEKNPAFTYTVKRARLYIESEYESKLDTVACTGSIFALKNMGWIDKVETKLSGSLGMKDLSQMSEEELQNELNEDTE